MVFKKRVLPLLVAGLLTTFGLVTSGASAHTPARFTSEATVTTIQAVQDGLYVVKATNLELMCEVLELHATVVGTSFESGSAVPTLEKCFAEAIIGTINATVTGFGAGECELVLRATGTGDLSCAVGKEVTFDVGTCVVHLPAQTGVKTFTFTTAEHAGKHALTVHFNIDNLIGNHTDGFGCPFEGGGPFSGTKANGTAIAWGTDQAGNPVGITWDATVP